MTTRTGIKDVDDIIELELELVKEFIEAMNNNSIVNNDNKKEYLYTILRYAKEYGNNASTWAELYLEDKDLFLTCELIETRMIDSKDTQIHKVDYIYKIYPVGMDDLPGFFIMQTVMEDCRGVCGTKELGPIKLVTKKIVVTEEFMEV